MLSCAHVLPMWSADVDPCVAAVRAIPLQPGADGASIVRGIVRTVRSCSGEHLLIDRGGMLVRLDVIDGSVVTGTVRLHFDLPDDEHLESRIVTIRALRGSNVVRRRHAQLAHRILALEAIDARAAGASLKEIAELLLGPGDWPGDGEYRKSLVRRMVATGYHLIAKGPRSVLAS